MTNNLRELLTLLRTRTSTELHNEELEDNLNRILIELFEPDSIEYSELQLSCTTTIRLIQTIRLQKKALHRVSYVLLHTNVTCFCFK
jgi:hypothetical protein